MSRRRNKYKMMMYEDEIIKPNHFEQFIMKICEMDEWDLRDWLKKVLTNAGFRIIEDDYDSVRSGRYKEIHNMLAIRGEHPKVCLVAHTDCVRNHSWRNDKHEKPTPILKEIFRYGKKQKIITDKTQSVQIGGDDRLGCAINTWIALNTGYDMGLIFCTDEEIGAVSSEFCSLQELNDFSLLCGVDRGNQLTDQLVVQIGGTELCSRDMARRLLEISKSINMPRMPVNGLLTDVLELRRNYGIDCCNMTCGYHDGHSRSEYIVVGEAENTMKYVSAIIQDFEMDTIQELNS